MIAKFHRTELVIYCHSREGKSLSYSQINTVIKADDYKSKNTAICNSKCKSEEQSDGRRYRISSVIRRSFFPSKTIPKI